jgi:hypothetical protein
MDQQFWFNLYAQYIVGLLAQSLLAWELGRTGFALIFKKGPGGMVKLAFVLFLIQGIWQRVSDLERVVNSIYDYWPLAVAVGVYFYASSTRSISNNPE